MSSEEPEVKIAELSIAHFQSAGYGKIAPDEPLESHNDFSEFYDKFRLAISFYLDMGFPINAAMSHLAGIDFTKDVDLVELPEGHRVTQMQVPWGLQGNYYSYSEHSANELGIADRGRMFKPLRGKEVPAWYPPDEKEDIKRGLAKIEAAFPADEFPPLPGVEVKRPKRRTTAKQEITKKRARTYEATEAITVLRTVAREVEDTWSVPGETVWAEGGGQQFCCKTDDKAALKQVAIGAADEDCASVELDVISDISDSDDESHSPPSPP